MPELGSEASASDILLATAIADWDPANANCNGAQGDCTDGQDIETWHDVGTGGNNFTNPSGTDRPLYTADCDGTGAKTYPCVTFDGDDNMSAGDVLDAVFAGADSDFTLVVVSQAHTSSGSTIGKWGANAAWFLQPYTSTYTGSNFQAYFDAAGTNWRAWTAPFSSTNSDLHAYIFPYDGSVDTGEGVDRFSSNVDKWDVTMTHSNGGGTLGDIYDSSSPLCVGDLDCVAAPGSFPFTGDIARIIVFGGVLGAADMTTLKDYLHTTYGLTRPPPGYKIWFDGQDINGNASYNSSYSDGETLVAALGGKGSKANTYTVAGDPIIDKTCDVLTGADCIVFDGTTDNLTSSDQAQSIDPPIACYVATLSTGTNSNYYLMFWAAQTAGTDGFVFGADTTSNGWKLFNGSTLTATETATPGNLYMVTIESDSTAQFRVNAAATDISGNPGTRNIGESDMAKIRTGQSFETSIVEALFYDQDVADPGLTNCETYFQERYGTSFWQ